jgi:hypothetical protein
MPTETETPETETTEVVPAEVQAEAEPATQQEGEPADAEASELVVSLGDEPSEPPPKEESSVIRTLRQITKSQAKELKELRQRAAPAEDSPTAKLRAEPTMEAHDFDADAFKEDWRKWNSEKAALERAAEDKKRSKQQAEESERAAWNAKLEVHAKRRAELPVKDYDAAEETVFDLLDETQRGIVINYSDNSALLVYALGRNPAKLSDLAACKDPGAFIKAMTKLESNLKTSKRRPETKPETRIERGAAGVSTSSASELEKLRAEAEKTGNYTKVMAYKARLKTQAAK